MNTVLLHKIFYQKYIKIYKKAIRISNIGFVHVFIPKESIGITNFDFILFFYSKKHSILIVFGFCYVYILDKHRNTSNALSLMADCWQFTLSNVLKCLLIQEIFFILLHVNKYKEKLKRGWFTNMNLKHKGRFNSIKSIFYYAINI